MATWSKRKRNNAVFFFSDTHPKRTLLLRRLGRYRFHTSQMDILQLVLVCRRGHHSDSWLFYSSSAVTTF